MYVFLACITLQGHIEWLEFIIHKHLIIWLSDDQKVVKH